MRVISGGAGESPCGEEANREWRTANGRPYSLFAVRVTSAPSLLTARGRRCDARPHLVGRGLEQLLGDAEQPLAPVHLVPHVLRVDAGGDPQHDQIVEEMGALAH